jgi:hypothetical protein
MFYTLSLKQKFKDMAANIKNQTALIPFVLFAIFVTFVAICIAKGTKKAYE